MRRWRFNVIRSFFSYLGAEYGKNWMALLLSRKRPRPIERDHSSVASRSGSDTGGGAKGAKVRNEFKVLTEEFSRKELLEDVRKGLPVLGQVIQSTWWEWSSGSSLFFWRWNGREQIKASRDGMRIFIQGKLPHAKRIKPLRLLPAQTELVSSKIEGMVSRGYLSVGPVRSCLHFFAVPKGPTDVRIVYDGTSCGLNEALWAPNFYLPTSKAAALLLTFSSWLADADYGKCSITSSWMRRLGSTRGGRVETPLLR
ncbi:hypothetical protein MHU86_5235 [Fragilaria crotonensis]|nr:hypothetical protein MHU86_5235 [Fragilaria crotonensis]